MRRTTVAHGLGHLLFDPPHKLEVLRFDAFDDLDRALYEVKDPVAPPPWRGVHRRVLAGRTPLIHRTTRRDEMLEVTFRAAGFAPVTKYVVATRDQKLQVILKKAP